ncbi:hypothetical protein ABIB25_000030 [Nakamurella sp. UYEF19]|uniref:hypothetical protein n=1 Tax=Nakamurella sp. UYEF19 TaxID=1756392 RepID=UPI003390F431
MSIFTIRQPVIGADIGAFSGIVDAVRQAADVMTAHGWPVSVLHSTYIPGEQTCVSVVDAEDAVTVMEMLRRAGSRTATVLPALML